MKISREQQAKINEIAKKYHLGFVILHGSRATGKIVSQHPDIDIAIYRRGGIPSEEYLQLVNAFMGVFGNDIDLKTLHKKDALFRFEVMQNAQLLYGSKALFNELFIYAYKDFHDKKPLYENMAKIQEKRQRLLNQLYA